MSDLYKFEDVYSTGKVKFSSKPKEIHETPRGVKAFQLQEKFKRAINKKIKRSLKRHKDIRERKKNAVLAGQAESSEEERPHDKFTRQINKENPLASPIFNEALKLRDQLTKKF